ncbi:MAG: hypothetical protein IK138_10390 [Lachnospiraceae bacterium]|nr:hypothetical protein [Lachnospiraceae bacterium]
MKRIVTRLVVLFAIVALVFGTLPAGSAEAASKKSKKKTIVVTTQEELVAALKKYGSSNSKVKIKIETTEASTFTLSAKYSSDSIQIVVDAPNATIKSKAKVSSITINEAKSVKEYASGNKITVNDEKLTFTAMENASVEKLTITSETGTVKVVNNGGIEKVSVKTEVKVDLTQNGEMGRVYVAAAADISVSGTSEESLKVTVQKEAVGASVKSEVPVSVNAYADVDLTLEKGAENSKVTMKEETAGVKLENNTEETVSVKDTEGNTQKVETGEDLTTDNFVGKTEDTPETPDGGDGTVTEQHEEEDKKEENKEEEKKDEEKPEEKKDDTTGTGSDNNGTGNTTPVDVPTETELFIRELSAAHAKAAENSYTAPVSVELKKDLTLTEDIVIPTGVQLFIGYENSKATLDAGSYVITLSENSQIIVSSQSKLNVEEQKIVYSPEDKVRNTEAWLVVEPGAEFNFGAYRFIADADQGVTDPHHHICAIRYACGEDWHWDKDKDRDVRFFNSAVSVQNNGGAVTITGEGAGLDALPDAFGVSNYILNIPNTDWNAFENARNIVPEDGVFSYLEFTNGDNLICDKFVTKFGNETIYKYENSDVDWLNAYLDPNRANEISDAEKAGKYSTISVEKSDVGGIRTVTIPSGNSNGAAISITGELRIPVGSKLITNIPLNMKEYGAVLKIMGTFESQANYYDGLGVCSSVIGSSKEKAGVPHLIVEMCGPQARLVLYNNQEYFFNYSFGDGREVDLTKIDPEQQGLAIEAYSETVDTQTYYPTVWEYIYIPEDTKEGTPHWMVYRKTKGDDDSTAVEVVNHPFKDTFISLSDLKSGTNIGTIDNKYELVNFLDWSNSVAWLFVNENWNNLTGIKEALDENSNKYVDFSGIAANAFDGIENYANIGWHKFSTNTQQYLTLPARKSSDGNNIPWELSAVELKLNDYTAGELCSMRLRQEASLKVSMGGTLVVQSVKAVSKETENLELKALALDYDASATQDVNKGARIDVCLGGALQIGDIKVSVPDNCTGDWNSGKPGISLSAEYDKKRDVDNNNKVYKHYLRLQVPQCAKFTKIDNETETIPTAAEINAWLLANNISIDFIAPCKLNGEEYFVVTGDPDRAWILKRAAGGLANNSIEELIAPKKDSDGYYEIKESDQLRALYMCKGDGSGSESIKVRIDPDNAYNELVLNSKLETMWDVEIVSGKKLTVNPGSVLEAAVTVASCAAIDIQVSESEYGELRTTQGGNITVKAGGTINVYDGTHGNGNSGEGKAKLVSQKGGRVIVEAGGTLEIYGTFECGGYKSADVQTPEVWFANNGTVNNNGSIIVTIFIAKLSTSLTVNEVDGIEFDIRNKGTYKGNGIIDIKYVSEIALTNHS